MLLCHSELPFAAGGFVGLDIFFVLSGFLITGLILGEIDRTGRLSLRDFYARRAKRLLPLAATVLIAILIASVIIFTAVRREHAADDVFSAALYFVNWHFIAQHIDYFAFTDGDISPVQHYWSLSVEEQFYIFWPALLLVSAGAARLVRLPARSVMWAVVVTVTGASLIYGIGYSSADPQSAYFSTLTRIWELSLGACLTLALPRSIKLPRPVPGLLVGGGVLAIIFSFATFKQTIPYPGDAALIPTLGTAFVIIGGSATISSLPARMLSIPPLQYLGKISYAWYLWHWPLIVFAMAIWGTLSPGWLVLASLAAWIPAEISHRLIETRFHHSRTLSKRPRRAMAVGFSFTAAAVAVAVVVSISQPFNQEAPLDTVAGAEAAGGPPQKVAKAVRPDPYDARNDRSELYDDGCLVDGEKTESGTCTYGDPDSDKTVVLFGDSHALQYFPALKRLADTYDWKLVGLTRGGCTTAMVAYQPECDKWRENSLERIEKIEDPDMIVTANGTTERYRVKVDGHRLSRSDSEPLLIQGFHDTLKRLVDTGASVAVLRDQARAPFIPADCVAEHSRDLDRCAFTPDRSTQSAFDYKATKETKGARLIDPAKVLCPHNHCRSVIGNALVYRDSYHMSATFARTLAPWLYKQLPTPLS